ncbi:MAG: hypothetical protein AAF135_18300, partial [Bacteroidota bacterium]
MDLLQIYFSASPIFIIFLSKLNRRHQHAYKFNFKGSEENPIVQVEIEGIDGMSFERKMIKIGDAEKYIRYQWIYSKY